MILELEVRNNRARDNDEQIRIAVAVEVGDRHDLRGERAKGSGSAAIRRGDDRGLEGPVAIAGKDDDPLVVWGHSRTTCNLVERENQACIAALFQVGNLKAADSVGNIKIGSGCNLWKRSGNRGLKRSVAVADCGEINGGGVNAVIHKNEVSLAVAINVAHGEGVGGGGVGAGHGCSIQDEDWLAQ